MTQDEIIRMAKEAGIGSALSHQGGELRVYIEGADWHDELKRFAELVAAAEKEECAKVMDDMAAQDKHSNYYKVAAKAIRARGNT